MGWYENQKARNEAHKAQQRETRQRRQHERAVSTTTPPAAIEPAAARAQVADAYGRMANLGRVQAWLLTVQLFAMVVPIILVLVVFAWVAWAVLF